jgi:dolichyl-phosphate-mannose--protein O-mannosyl transferase
MKSGVAVGKPIAWWCGHLFLLLVCGLLFQAFASALWLIIPQCIAASQRRLNYCVGYLPCIIYSVVMVVVCYFWGQCLLKRMVNNGVLVGKAVEAHSGRGWWYRNIGKLVGVLCCGVMIPTSVWFIRLSCAEGFRYNDSFLDFIQPVILCVFSMIVCFYCGKTLIKNMVNDV